MNAPDYTSHLHAAPPLPSLEKRIAVLGEVVESLVERTEMLEEQRTMLDRKIEMLEGRARRA